MDPPTCSSLASQASAVEIGGKAMADLKKTNKQDLIYLSCFPPLYLFRLFKGSFQVFLGPQVRVPHNSTIVHACTCVCVCVCVPRPICAYVGVCVFFECLFDICSFYFKFGLDFNAINLKVSFKSKVKVVHNSLVHSLSPNFIEV